MAEAPLKAQPRLGLALSWPQVTSAFLIDVAVLVLSSHLPRVPQSFAWSVGVAVAAVVTIGALLAYRTITVASALAPLCLRFGGVIRIMRPSLCSHRR
jgi:hypothetical protein